MISIEYGASIASELYGEGENVTDGWIQRCEAVSGWTGGFDEETEMLYEYSYTLLHLNNHCYSVAQL